MIYNSSELTIIIHYYPVFRSILQNMGEQLLLIYIIQMDLQIHNLLLFSYSLPPFACSSICYFNNYSIWIVMDKCTGSQVEVRDIIAIFVHFLSEKQITRFISQFHIINQLCRFLCLFAFDFPIDREERREERNEELDASNYRG